MLWGQRAERPHTSRYSPAAERRRLSWSHTSLGRSNSSNSGLNTLEPSPPEGRRERATQEGDTCEVFNTKSSDLRALADGKAFSCHEQAKRK